jgi:hypothetical protein
MHGGPTLFSSSDLGGSGWQVAERDGKPRFYYIEEVISYITAQISDLVICRVVTIDYGIHQHIPYNSGFVRRSPRSRGRWEPLICDIW